MEIKLDSDNIISKAEYLFYQNKTSKNTNNNTYNNKLSDSSIITKYLIIENNDNIFLRISIYELDNEQNICTLYQNSFSTEFFLNLSYYFRVISKISSLPVIEKIFLFLKQKLDNETNYKKYKIKIKNPYNYGNKRIFEKSNLSLKFSHINDSKETLLFSFFNIYFDFKKEQIKLNLNKISMDSSNNSNLISLIIKEKFNNLEKLYSLNQEFKKENKKKDKLRATLERCNVYFGQNMEIKMDFLSLLDIDTDIFLSFDEYEFIINYLQDNIFTLEKRKIKLKQLFKASCNGDNIKAFHKYVKNYKNNLTLIMTDEKKRIGGFTQEKWDTSNKFKEDDKAFLFSLDNIEIYPIAKKYINKAIKCCEDFYAPEFGEDLFIFDGFFSSQLSKVDEKFYDYSNSKIEGDYKLTGQEYFTVTEMEVYEVVFDEI